MTVQIAVRLDDSLAQQIKTAAAESGTNLSEWVRSALARQAAASQAFRARAEEDAREPLYTAQKELDLMRDRHRRAIAALEET